MRWKSSLLLSALLVARTTGGHAAEAPEALADGLYAVWETPRGTITAELYYELVPLTVANFVGLAEGALPFTTRPPGEPYFDGLTFHRVVPGFVVQGGCPLGTGEGTPGYEFADEFTPALKHDAAGMLSMANAGPTTNGSQFFFTLAPVNRLNYKHSVFGRVIQGLDVLPQIMQGDVMSRVRILRVGVRADSFRADAESFAALQARTPPIPPRNPSLPPLFANEAGLPLRPGYDGWIAEKLHHYATTTGITVFVRLISKFAPAPERAAGHNPLRSLHEELAGPDARAATIVFVAGDNRWRLWLGDELLERFGLTPASVGGEESRKQLHELKQTLLAEAKTFWSLPEEPRHRAVDSAVTDLIEALDRPATVNR